MLTEEIIEQLRDVSSDEDSALWTQGDILVEHEVTVPEIKRLAVILQQNAAKLRRRQFVASETPTEQRREDYSWTLYSIFTNIEDQANRFRVMFSRTEWTLADAREIVNALQPKMVEQNKLTHVEYANLKVGNVKVKAKLDPKGNLTLLVSLGSNRVCEVTPQSVNTKIVFPA